jgi:hypothetical protein
MSVPAHHFYIKIQGSGATPWHSFFPFIPRTLTGAAKIRINWQVKKFQPPGTFLVQI